MYDNNEELENEEETTSGNGSFLSNFYNNNKKLIWILIGVIVIIILLSILSKGKGNQPNNSSEKQLKVVITDYNNKNIEKGEITPDSSIRLKATIDGIKNPTFTWSSSDNKVASVESGLVKGKKLGVTIITATYEKENGEKINGTCEITVSKGDPSVEVKSVTFPQGDLIMKVNSQYELKPTIFPPKGYLNSVKYTSSDESIAIVDDNGIVMALKVGSASITVDVNDGAYKDTIDVYVSDNVQKNELLIKADSVLFNGQLEKIKLGETSQLAYDVSPIEADINSLIWKSSNPNIVEVKNGNVKGIALGTSIISVYDVTHKEIGSVTIEVVENIIDVNSVSLQSNYITMNVLEQQQIRPIVKPDDASNKALQYSPSDPTIVMVVSQENGMSANIIALKKGVATITIKSNNDKVTYLTVNVLDNNGGNVNPTTAPVPSSNPTPSGNTTYYVALTSELKTTKAGTVGHGTTNKNVQFAIMNSTTKLKICSYKYGLTECNTSSGRTFNGGTSSAATYTGIDSSGTWVVKVDVYNNNTLVKTDKWYILILDSASTPTPTPATGVCCCTSTKSQCTWHGSLSNCSSSSEPLQITGATMTNCGDNVISTKTATIPTNSYCKTGLVYNGSSQTLTKTPGEGYTFSGNTATLAGIHTVSAVLKPGYKWNDGTTTYKTIYCSIANNTTSTPTPNATPNTDINSKKTINLTSSATFITGLTEPIRGAKINITTNYNNYTHVFFCTEKNGGVQCPDYMDVVKGNITTVLPIGSYFDGVFLDQTYDTRAAGIPGYNTSGQWYFTSKNGMNNTNYNLRFDKGERVKYFVVKMSYEAEYFDLTKLIAFSNWQTTGYYTG